MASHWKVVDCATAAALTPCACLHYRDGWQTEFNPNDPDVDRYLAELKAGGYRWRRVEPIFTPGFVAFAFPPEQRCLASREMPHVVPRDRLPLLRVLNGDWRELHGMQRVHTREEDFVDHLRTTVDQLETQLREG